MSGQNTTEILLRDCGELLEVLLPGLAWGVTLREDSIGWHAAPINFLKPDTDRWSRYGDIMRIVGTGKSVEEALYALHAKLVQLHFRTKGEG